MKTCTVCHRVRPLDAFGPHPATADRHQHRCRPCAYAVRVESQQVARAHRRAGMLLREEDLPRRAPGRELAPRTSPRHSTPSAASRAHNAVAGALASGDLERGACSALGGCTSQRPAQAYHPLGYAREHWLEVVWLCPMHLAEARKSAPSDSI